MSVYKPKGKPHFHYDFQWKGKRFHGSTGCATKRAAEEYERKVRQDAALGRLNEASQMTLDQAAGKWWAEKGKDRGDADDVHRRVKRLLDLIGKDTPLVEISTKVVSDAIQKRRNMSYRKGAKGQTYLPSNATVNRDVIETLRPILRRARRNWEAQGLPEIPWDELRLQEPPETIQSYSDAQLDAWASETSSEVKLAIELLTTYGLRFGELFFPLDKFEPEGPRLNLQRGRKWKVPHTVPLLEDHARAIAARVTRAQAADLPHIWFEQGKNGKLIELSYYQLQGRINTAARRAGIKEPRKIHGARHHAGTVMLRKTGNLKLTQRLLGHRDIKSTMRYAHAFEEDLLEALEAKPKKRKKAS